MLYSVKCFFCINWDNHVILFFNSLNVVFLYIELSLHFSNNSHFIMIYNPLTCCLIDLLIFSWEVLHQYSCGILVCGFLFLYCVWFWYQDNAVPMDWIRKCSLLFNFLEEFEKNWCYILFKAFIEFNSEVIWS